jgi:hypothetical protein
VWFKEECHLMDAKVKLVVAYGNLDITNHVVDAQVALYCVKK